MNWRWHTNRFQRQFLTLEGFFLRLFLFVALSLSVNSFCKSHVSKIVIDNCLSKMFERRKTSAFKLIRCLLGSKLFTTNGLCSYSFASENLYANWSCTAPMSKTDPKFLTLLNWFAIEFRYQCVQRRIPRASQFFAIRFAMHNFHVTRKCHSPLLLSSIRFLFLLLCLYFNQRARIPRAHTHQAGIKLNADWRIVTSTK